MIHFIITAIVAYFFIIGLLSIIMWFVELFDPPIYQDRDYDEYGRIID